MTISCVGCRFEEECPAPMRRMKQNLDEDIPLESALVEFSREYGVSTKTMKEFKKLYCRGGVEKYD